MSRNRLVQIQLSITLLLDALLGVVASFGHMNMLTKVEVKERKLVVQTCSNQVLNRKGYGAFWWTKMTLIEVRLCKIITICICDLLDFFLGFLWKYFLQKYLKSLKWAEMVLGGFVQYFEHDHVFKLIYMENICPLSFPKFSQIFLKH